MSCCFPANPSTKTPVRVTVSASQPLWRSAKSVTQRCNCSTLIVLAASLGGAFQDRPEALHAIGVRHVLDVCAMSLTYSPAEWQTVS